MPGILVSDIIQRASVQADMVDGFVDSSTWLSWFKQESKALDILLARNGWAQAIKFDTQTVTTDSMTVASGNDILAVIGVWEVVNNRYRHLTLKAQPDFYLQPAGTGGVTGRATQWTLAAPQNGATGGTAYTVNLYPRPLGGTYAIGYLATQYGDGSTPALTDVVYYPMGFEEWIVLRLARRALIKEESSTSGIDQLLTDEEQKIEEACWERQLTETPSVRNVDRAERGWDNMVNFPPPIGWYWV